MIAEVLAAFPSRRALVVGDICLDRWCTYDPGEAEPSRETGIPRIAVTGSENTPGAGGTIANNLAALGVGEVAVLGVIGDDGHGFELRQALAKRKIRHDLCIASPDVCTFTYTKLLNRGADEDKPRVDFINTRPLPSSLDAAVTARLRDAAPEFDAIIVSDQAETNAGGVVTPAMRDTLHLLSKQFPAKVFWVDSRRRPELFRGVIVKPNEDEARDACLRAFGAVDFARLRESVQAPLLVVTHGPRGALLLAEGFEQWAPAVPVPNPVDICGAGDSFSAAAAMTLTVQRDPLLAARLGNLVASITIMKKGTGTASPAEVLARLQ